MCVALAGLVLLPVLCGFGGAGYVLVVWLVLICFLVVLWQCCGVVFLRLCVGVIATAVAGVLVLVMLFVVCVCCLFDCFEVSFCGAYWIWFRGYVCVVAHSFLLRFCVSGGCCLRGCFGGCLLLVVF